MPKSVAIPLSSTTACEPDGARTHLRLVGEVPQGVNKTVAMPAPQLAPEPADDVEDMWDNVPI